MAGLKNQREEIRRYLNAIKRSWLARTWNTRASAALSDARSFDDWSTYWRNRRSD